MFLVNSCLGLFTAASFEAPLLPKLRGHLAEFLNNPSPVGLRILSSSTCVGLRYGHLSVHTSFSRLTTSVTSLLYFVPFRPSLPFNGLTYSQASFVLKCRWLRTLYRMCIDYAFRAGQNLPDKEFRYLRTVIVTAAVHWGFGSKLRIAPNSFP